MYRMHNYHFGVRASMFDGQYAMAMKFAEASEKQQTVTCKIEDIPLGSMYWSPLDQSVGMCSFDLESGKPLLVSL